MLNGIRRHAYTLVELLVVMSIIAILSAVFAPVIKTSLAAAHQYTAGQQIQQVGVALQNYTADFDDVYPFGMHQTDDGGIQAWFGYQDAAANIDVSRGSMANYLGKRRPFDSTASDYRDYFGDHSGFGYNYETLGSDFSETQDFSGFPNCENPANTSQLEHPSTTVAFATSVFFKAPWLPEGDGAPYDFGFVSPPRDWVGNPNMDFRHMGTREVDGNTNTVRYTGNALVLWADGRMKPLKQLQVQNIMFERADSGATGDANAGPISN